MDGSATDPLAGLASEGQGTPLLALDGFTGPLQRLLTLARTQRIDLARLPLGDLVDQLVVALQHAPPATPLGQKGDWVVMTAWLVQLRSLLLLPVDHPAHRAAKAEADQLRERLVSLREMQALASWLDRRPQLGCDVFARGQPELVGTTVETDYEVDVIEFLWAGLALFDDADARHGYRLALPADLVRPAFCPGSPRPHPAAAGRGAGRRAARPVSAGGPRGSGDRAAAAFSLDHHLRGQPGTRQARPAGSGAGRAVPADPGEPALGDSAYRRRFRRRRIPVTSRLITEAVKGLFAEH